MYVIDLVQDLILQALLEFQKTYNLIALLNSTFNNFFKLIYMYVCIYIQIWILVQGQNTVGGGQNKNIDAGWTSKIEDKERGINVITALDLSLISEAPNESKYPSFHS